MRSRPIILALLIVFLIANIAVVILRGRRTSPLPDDRIARLHERRSSLLQNWSQDQIVLLNSDDLPRVIDTLKSNECFPSPRLGIDIPISKLDPHQRKDLTKSITELIQAYLKGTASAIIDYMKDRNELPEPNHVANLRKSLVERKADDRNTILSMAPEDVIRRTWNDRVNTHWQGLYQGSSCLQLWELSQHVGDKLQTGFGLDYYDTFPTVMKYVHGFAPARTLEQQLQDEGRVLIADVKLIIQFDNRLRHQPSPQFLRLWYSTSDRRWHPLTLVRGEVDSHLAEQSEQLF